MGQKFWIISEYYYPVTTSTGYYMTEIAQFLARKGLAVEVICSASKYNESSFSSTVKDEVYEGVHIHRITSSNIDKNSLFKRFIRLLLSSFRLFFKVLFIVRKGDNLLVATNPAFLILMMPIIASLKNVDYTILVHDVFPENLVAIKKMSKSSYLYKVIKFLYDKAYTQARDCIVIGRDMREILLSKTRGKSRITVIPIWSDNKSVYPVEKEKTDLYKKLGILNKFIFQFAGNMGQAQGLDNLLEAIKQVNNDSIHFLFIGGGAKYEMIEKFVLKKKDKSIITLLPFQDKKTQNDFLNACDIGIVTLSDGMYGLGVPSKSYNIMAAGKPILFIGDSNSEIARCIIEYNIGWVMEPNNPEGLRDQIEWIFNHTDEIPAMRERAREVAENVFAKKVILEKYYQLLCP